MANLANLDDDRDLTLASQQSSDEQIVRLPPEESALVNQVLLPGSSTGDEQDDLALAMRLSQLSSDDFDEQVARLHRIGPAPASKKACSSTSPNEGDEDDLELALNLSQLPADDVFDGHASELGRGGESPTAIENNLASFLMAMSIVEGDTPGGLDGLLAAEPSDDAWGSVPHDDYFQALALAQHGASLLDRNENTGAVADLEDGISALSTANSFIPDDHPMKPELLNALGKAFHRRFERVGGVADVDGAIAAQQQAVRLDAHNAMYFHRLGIFFLSRFERLGFIADVEEAVRAQQQAVRLTPDGDSDKLRYLNSLGISLLYRFRHLGDIDDVNQAIAAQQHVVSLTPDGHSYKPGRLSNLGNSFRVRFERLGAIADVDEAITAQQHAVRLTPDGHPEKCGRINNLGISFLCRFERLGEIADVDKAITAQQQAVRLTPDGHPRTHMYLNSLGNAFIRRFERLGDITDIDEGIMVQRQSIHATPDGHPDKAMYLHNLGTSFLCRFERLGNIADVDEAITFEQQAVDPTPDGHPRKPMYLNGLGGCFLHRFDRLGDVANLDNAITAQGQAVRLTPEGHPYKPARLNNLGSSFLRRFQHLGDIADVDEAISAHQQAIRLTPDGHRNKSTYLNSLGTAFYAQLNHHPDEAAFAQAVSAFSQSAKSSSGPPSHRFMGARMWSTLCFLGHSSETLDAYSTLFDLLPRVVWLGRTVEQRYKDISIIGDAVSGAAAAAIHLGKFSLALEWLEQGRSIVWGQILQLRTPLENLRQYHPFEAGELERISRALESAATVGSLHHSNLSDVSASQTPEEAAQAHRRLADEYEGVIERIRGLPDFSEFLLPRKSASLCSAAVSGPVVIVNVHTSRCDALILHPHSSQVSHVALSGLQVSATREMQVQMAGLTRGVDAFRRDYEPYSDGESVGLLGHGVELSYILGELWLHIVEPILHSLESLQKSAPGKMPHISWCLTGPLAFLPIHAAGLYDTKDQPKIFDYVVSSYAPTLTALLSAKRLPAQRSGPPRLLAVSQPATPRQQPLPGTVREVNAIQTIHGSGGRLPITPLNDQEATVAAVLQGMRECHWIHLACHGVQDATNVTDSAFVLVDGRLTLREIMKQSFSHTELAVLSACQTAKGDKELSEEAVHLAAGMLLAGYGSIVATMWSIRDDDGPIIAEKFYRHLIVEASGDSTRAAYALHEAVAHLRDIRGEKDFASWVPFIHLGICSSSLSSI